MPDESVGDECSSSSWRPHCDQHQQILELHKLKSFPVIPPTVVKVLTDKLNWRLSAIRLLFRHVQVINEHNAFLTDWWAVVTLSSFFHFTVNGILCLISSSLGGKDQTNVLISI